jgi:hypothetical protein
LALTRITVPTSMDGVFGRRTVEQAILETANGIVIADQAA